jgi:hypothetical protein
VDVLVSLLRDTPGDMLARAVNAWWATDPESRGDIVARLQALTVTSAAFCPPLTELLSRQVLEPAAAVLGQLGSSVWDLQPWATTVTGILTHRARLEGDDVVPGGACATSIAMCMVLGTAIASLINWRARRPAYTYVVVVAVLTFVSLGAPVVSAGASTGTKLTLIVAHLIAAAVIVPVVARCLAKRV